MGPIDKMGKISLAGTLDFLSLGDIMQLLGSNSSTGILQLKSKYVQEPGLIYWGEGNPVNATSGSLTGIKALYSLFGWLEGEFEFTEEDTGYDKKIKKGRMEIILDGLSMLDDGEIEKIGPVSFKNGTSDKGDGESTLPLIKGPVVDYMYVVDEETYYKGSKIVAEGKHGNWIWVVLDGILDIVKETDQGDITLLRLSNGAFLGSMASLFRGSNVRSATIVAVTDVQLGTLDAQRLDGDSTKMTRAFKEFVLSLDKRLKDLTTHAINIHLKKIDVNEYIKEKKVIIKEGQDVKGISKIIQGHAYVVRKKKFGYVPLLKLEKGDFIGHVPFLEIGLEPYSATVLGSEDLETEEVNIDDLQKEYERLSTTVKNIIDNVAVNISVTSRVAVNFQKKNSPQKKGTPIKKKKKS